VVSAGDTPGAAWNAGIRGLAAATHVSCLAAGDRLDRRFTRLALQAMSVAPAPAFVSPGSSDGNMAMGRPATPSRIDAAALLSDFDLADPASVFCRWTFEAAGGFDERLPTLASFDLFLRLLGANGAGARLPWALVEPAKALTLPDAGQRALALSLIVDSHREMFSTCWRDVLTGRASALQRLEQARRQDAALGLEVILRMNLVSAHRRRSPTRKSRNSSWSLVTSFATSFA